MYPPRYDILPHDLSIVDAWGFASLVEEYSQIPGRITSDDKILILIKLCIDRNSFDVICNMLLGLLTYY